MQPNHTILGIHIRNRIANAPQVQAILTQYGDHIKTRLGLHDIKDRRSAGTGIVLLEMVGPDHAIAAMVKKVRAVKGVQIKTMVFGH